MVGGVTTDNASIAMLFPQRRDVAIALASVGVDQRWQRSYRYCCLTACSFVASCCLLQLRFVLFLLAWNRPHRHEVGEGFPGRAPEYDIACDVFIRTATAAAREVAVAALGTVYDIEGGKEAAVQIGQVLATKWSLATALSLLAWYIFAPQCASTLAVVRRETGSWHWMAVTFAYMFALAYAASFAVYNIAHSLGAG